MSAAGADVRRAAVLGTVTGARTFLAPAALALRGRMGKVAKFVVPALAAGELVGDKLPSAPPRIEGPGLVARLASGAVAGRVSAGSRGARVGAAFALASAYPSQFLRGQVVARTRLPDIACAVPEDLLGIALATAASTEPKDAIPPQADVDGPKTPATVEFSAHQHGDRRGFVTAGALGVGAGLVGAAAMATARQWVYGFTGGEDPAALGRLIYGPGCGLPFGLLAARGLRTPRPRDGVALGVGAWAVSLAKLPALGLAPPPWQQSPATLAQELGFHLLYGAATAAALEALIA